jgi:YegS/Rv2252/BmrU family lipid kinase
MKHLFIVNPVSFLKSSDMDDVINDINAYFSSVKDLEYFVHVSRYPRDAVSVIRKYMSRTDDTVRVYAVGGDGIVFDCLNGIASFNNTELAVIPYGTANDFSRAFGEDKAHILRNIEKQVNADTIPTDLINVGFKRIIGFCAAGLEASAVIKYYKIRMKYPSFAKRHGKTLYFLGAFSSIMDKKISQQEYEVTIDGKSFDGKYATIIIANNSGYGGNKTPAPMAHPADGFLDILMTKGVSRLRLLSVVTQYTSGKYYKYPRIFTHVRGKQVSIRSNSPLLLNTDGESYYDTHVDAKILPGAVKVASPDGIGYVIRRELA